MSFSTIINALNEKGKAFAREERKRQRTAYILSRLQAKITDWNDHDDDAFDRIDETIKGLCISAGYVNSVPPPAPSRPVVPAELRG